MDVKKNIAKNSAYSVVLQLILIPLNFIVRWILLKYIGINIVGISGTIKSLVGVLCLAEGGFGSAIMYCLYKPVLENDTTMINKIMMALKTIYCYVGVFILLLGFILSLFLPDFLTGVEVDAQVYIIFFLECLNAALSYFLCYRRSLLSASLRSYIIKQVDIICNILFGIVGIIFVLLTKQYTLFLCSQIFKTIISNMILHFYCRKVYSYLKDEKTDKKILKEVVEYSKNLIFGNIASYIYNSTDNILISKFQETVFVGYLSNYTMITNYLKTLSAALLSGITPLIGHKQVGNNINKKKHVFLKYNNICYLLASCVSVPTYILLNDFITSIYGTQYAMNNSITILLTIIVYLFIEPFAYGDFISTGGYFKELKRVECVGAFLNIISSTIMVQFYGIEGVLVGTIFSTIVQIIMREYYVCHIILNYTRIDYIKHCMKRIWSVAIVLIEIIMVLNIVRFINVKIFAFRFFIYGLVSEAIVLVVYLSLYRFEDRILLYEIKDKILSNVIKRKK